MQGWTRTVMLSALASGVPRSTHRRAEASAQGSGYGQLRSVACCLTGRDAVAKRNRRKKQDRAKAEARRAQKSRLRALAGRQQQLADRYSRLLDPQTSPAKVAELLAAAIGLEPQVTEEKRAVPSPDFAWGPVPHSGDDGDGVSSAREWEKNWLDQVVAALNFRTPRQAAQGDAVDGFRGEALLRQLEYQAGLATARGQHGIDVAWLRAELDLVR
jgi:hypothetical protein